MGIWCRSFPSSRRETGLSVSPAVIQCIREIKASPHSCLMLTHSRKNWLRVDLGGSLPPLSHSRVFVHNLTLSLKLLSLTSSLASLPRKRLLPFCISVFSLPALCIWQPGRWSCDLPTRQSVLNVKGTTVVLVVLTVCCIYTQTLFLNKEGF